MTLKLLAIAILYTQVFYFVLIVYPRVFIHYISILCSTPAPGFLFIIYLCCVLRPPQGFYSFHIHVVFCPGFQVVVLLLYLSVLLGLYMAPLSITSPCIMDHANLTPRPDVIGHQGAPMVSQLNQLPNQRTCRGRHLLHYAYRVYNNRPIEM